MADNSLTRVSGIDPAVAQSVLDSPVERQRRISRAAVDWAIDTGQPVRTEVFESALTALESRRFGDSADRSALEGLVGELDEAAWDVQDQVDEGHASEDDYGRAFCRARAANCLWWALDDDPLEAAAEALYEAYAAADSDDPAALRRLVDAVE